MLFYTKSLQPAPGVLLIDFSYGHRMSHVTIESLYLHDHFDKLSYEYPSDNSETGSLDRSSVAPSPDVDKSKDFVIFSPNHGQDLLLPGWYLESSWLPHPQVGLIWGIGGDLKRRSCQIPMYFPPMNWLNQIIGEKYLLREVKCPIPVIP